MKNLNFKNFNYTMIDSAMSGYREVLVTCTVDGKIVRKCLFIEEVKGKDKNYYFAQAKKEIDASIKDGSLAKSASKQLRHGATKPVLITLSCVLAAGALGMGGYFLGSYLGGGGGSPVVTDGHTVVLYGGEGVFENHKTYLIFNNVKDKTPLGDIEGYALPSYEDYDFLKWNGPIEDQPYGTSFKITEDIVLTASFFEGIKYLKAQAINSINVELKYLLDNYVLGDSVKEMLNNIYEKSRSVINNIEESTDTAAVDDARNAIADLKECANETLDIVASTGAIYPESAAEIEKTYENALNSLVKEKSISKRAALVKFNSGYIKAASGATDITIVDKTYDELTKMLSDYDEEADSLNIRLLGHFAKGVIAGSAYFTDPKQIEKIIEDLLYWFEQLAAAGLKEDDTNTIDWVGEFFNYYYYASSRYDYLDPQIEPLEFPTTYGGFIKKSGSDAISAILDYLKNSSLESFTIFTLNDAMIKSLANVENFISLPVYGYFNKAIYIGDNDSSYHLLSNNLIYGLIAQIKDETSDKELKEAGKSMLNKILACFKNVMEAFSIWQGDYFDYLFSHIDVGIIMQVGQYYDLYLYQKGISSLLDNYVTLTEGAIEIAKKSLLEARMSYRDLCEFGEILINQTFHYGLEHSPALEFFNALSSLFDSIIPLSIDSGLAYVNKGQEIMSAIFYLFDLEVKNEESKNKAYFDFLINTIYGLFAYENHIYKGCSVLELEFATGKANESIRAAIWPMIATDKKALVELSSSKPTIMAKLGETIKYIFDDKWPEVLSIMDEELPKIFEDSNKIYNDIYLTLTGSLIGRQGPSSILDGSDLQFEAYFDTISAIFGIAPKLQNREKFMVAEEFVFKFVELCFHKNFAKATEIKNAFITNFINKVGKDMSKGELETLIAEVTEILEAIIGRD